MCRLQIFNLCIIDIPKAFDKVNQIIVLGKLMDRKILHVLFDFDWFAENYTTVKWMNVLSLRCKGNSGVRQGGVMSIACFIHHLC